MAGVDTACDREIVSESRFDFHMSHIHLFHSLAEQSG